VNLLALVTVELSVFVIVMLYRPVVAPAGMIRVPVIWVGETTLTFVRDIVVGARAYDTVAPGWNRVPVMVRPGAATRAPVAGALLVNVGVSALTVNVMVPDDHPHW
jgi:ABC-type proline/glycine betaine transport system substrate-binding protein